MIDVIEYDGEGYARLIGFEGWRVSFIRYAERFDPSRIVRLERHLQTDEVFVLIEGTGTLYSEDETLPMEKGKLYNVRCRSWHAVSCSRDALILIVENDDTGIGNTEYKERVVIV